MPQLSIQAEGEFNLPLPFVPFRPSGPTLGRPALPTQFSYSNANVFQKHLHRHAPQNNA